MSVDTNYNYNPTPVDISREEYTDVGSSAFQLGTAARTFGIDTDFEIWTAASGGTQLTEGSDYELLTKNNRKSSELGFDVKTRCKILNVTYQTGSIFITYKCYGSETDAEYFNELNATDVNLQSQIDALGGGITVVKTADYQILDDDSITRIEVDTTSDDVTITMPLIANNSGRQIEIAYVKGGTYKVIILPHATDSTKLTNDDLAVIWLPKVGDHITLRHSTSSGFWESVDERITSELHLNTYAGYGSTDTKIMRFTNVTSNVGNLFSENHVSGYSGNTKGLEITINRSGKYSFEFSNHPTGATNNIGFSLNSSSLTTDITAQSAGVMLTIAQCLTSVPNSCSISKYFKKNDVIRPHCFGAASSTYAVNSNFIATYLGN